jgi:hypothetical protein
MMAIDEGAKCGALREFSEPVNPVGTGKRLSQSEDRKKEAEDDDRSDKYVKAMRRISKNKRCCKVNEQC